MSRRICILTSVHDPFDNRVFFKEGRSLHRAGYRVVLIARHTRSETVQNIEIIPLRSPRNRLSRAVFTSLVLLVKALRERADAYHFHDPELIPVALLLKFLRRRVVYDVHEDVPRDIRLKEYIPASLRGIVAWAVERIEQTAARFFDGIVVATADIGKNFDWHPRMTLVRNLPLSTEYAKGKPPRAPDQPFTLAYAGGLTKFRGITQIVQAMARLPESVSARLWLCGAWDSVEYEREVRSLPGFARAEYLGKLSVDEIPALLAGVDAGLVCLQPTGTYERALPTKMFEYMAAGLPIIASNFALWREIVEQTGAGICVDPMDPDAIGRAILRLYQDPALSRKIGEQGRRVAQTRWRWETEERALIRLYRDLLGAI